MSRNDRLVVLAVAVWIVALTALAWWLPRVWN